LHALGTDGHQAYHQLVLHVAMDEKANMLLLHHRIQIWQSITHHINQATWDD
jgi:hypothetical protein